MEKTCPGCSAEVPIGTVICECGYNFSAASSGFDSGTAGWVLAFAGSAISAYAMFVFQPSAGGLYGDAYNNVGLLQDQLMIFLAGLTLVISGAITIATSAILDQLARNSRARGRPPTSD